MQPGPNIHAEREETLSRFLPLSILPTTVNKSFVSKGFLETQFKGERPFFLYRFLLRGVALLAVVLLFLLRPLFHFII